MVSTRGMDGRDLGRRAADAGSVAAIENGDVPRADHRQGREPQKGGGSSGYHAAWKISRRRASTMFDYHLVK